MPDFSGRSGGFSWSERRSSLFDFCRRAYFFRYSAESVSGGENSELLRLRRAVSSGVYVSNLRNRVFREYFYQSVDAPEYRRGLPPSVRLNSLFERSWRDTAAGKGVPPEDFVLGQGSAPALYRNLSAGVRDAGILLDVFFSAFSADDRRYVPEVICEMAGTVPASTSVVGGFVSGGILTLILPGDSIAAAVIAFAFAVKNMNYSAGAVRLCRPGDRGRPEYFPSELPVSMVFRRIGGESAAMRAAESSPPPAVPGPHCSACCFRRLCPDYP